MLGLVFLKLFVQLSTLLILLRHMSFSFKRHINTCKFLIHMSKITRHTYVL